MLQRHRRLRLPSPCGGTDPPLTQFCGGNLEGFSKACFSYFLLLLLFN